MSDIEWTADADYVMESTGVICVISGRTFTKVNEGKALVGAYYNGYTGPILVSTDPDAVTYNAGPSFTYIGTIEYLGLTWYISNTQYFMGGNQSVSGFAKKISNDNLTYTQAAQLLFELANVQIATSYEKKYLIFDTETEKYYNIFNEELNELDITELTSNSFITYGNDDIPSGTLLMTLQKPKILYWQNSDEDLPTLTANVTATPNPQSVITEKIDLTDSSITGIEKITAEYEGDPHIACSFDSGTTWKSYSNNQWVVLSEGDTGMTMTTFLAITADEWNTVTSGLDGFMIRFSLSDVNDVLTNIKIDFTN